jgi:hypothetical protein
MRKLVLAFLALMILAHAPWRLLAVAAEAEVMSPGLTRMPQTSTHYWDELALEARLVDLSWEVGYQPHLNVDGIAVYGVTIPSHHAIFIEEGLSWDARYAVLAHEGGHTLQPGWLSERQDEVFAEMVAAVVSGGVREHARYLSSSKVDVIVVLVTEWPAIYSAAAVLENR